MLSDAGNQRVAGSVEAIWAVVALLHQKPFVTLSIPNKSDEFIQTNVRSIILSAVEPVLPERVRRYCQKLRIGGRAHPC
jgi:hypothetical protein